MPDAGSWMPDKEQLRCWFRISVVRYKKLEIRPLASALVKDIHAMTIEKLPKLEMVLETLFATGSLTDSTICEDLSARLTVWGKKLNPFLKTVAKSHIRDKRFIFYPAARI